jgi:hypothetical protein
MNRNLSLLLSLLGAAIILSSCSLILHGSKQKVTFRCQREAEIKVNLYVVGKTNQIVEIPRRDLDGLVRVFAPGCETKELMLPIRPTIGSWIDIPLILLPYVGLLPAYIDNSFGFNQGTNELIDIELNCK